MRFLIIGLGSMGKRRIRNLLVNGEKEIIGFDVTEARRKEAEEKHGIKTVADLSELAPNDYDAIIISTPPNLHAPYIRKALAEKKHFFVEHTTSDEAYDEVMAASKDDGIVRAPSCSFRFHAAIMKLKELLDAGRIGKLLSYQYHLAQYLPDWHPWEDYRQVYFSKKETSAIREMLPFEQTWISWLVGAQIEEVCGWVGKISDLDMDADDFLISGLKYKNGVMGSFMIDVISRKPFRALRLMGSEGNLDWDWTDPTIRLYDAKTKQTETITVDIGKSETGYVNVEDMYIEEIKRFIQAVRGEKPWPYSYEEDGKNLRALYAVEKSSLTKTFQRI